MAKSEPQENPSDSVVFGLRLRRDVREELNHVKEFARYSDVTEMVRGWIMEKVNSYRTDPAYVTFLKRSGDQV